MGPTRLRAVSEYGNIVIDLQIDGLTEALFVETKQFDAVLSSLDDKDEIVFSVSGTSLKWTSGEARGHWQTVQQEHKVPDIAHDQFVWEPTKEFPEALLIASSACAGSAVSMGLFGVEMSFEGGQLKLISSNSIALAYTEVSAGELPAGSNFKICLRPPVPDILATILSFAGNAKVDITSDAIYIKSAYILAQLPTSAKLAHNLRAVLEKYPNAEHLAQVNVASLKKFLSRAKTLADKKQAVQIGIAVKDGKISLEHRGLTASSEEWFLAEGIETTAEFNSVSMPLDMLMIPLEHVDGIILDYMVQKTLVLVGADYGFTYIVGGK